jgi:glucans biosynthesis protein
MLDQENFLKIAVAAQASTSIPVNSGTSRLRLGEPQPFSYDWLKSHAQDLAAAPYHAPPQPDPGIVAAIDYDTYGHLKYKPDSALYGDGQPGVFPITFQYVGQTFQRLCGCMPSSKAAESWLARSSMTLITLKSQLTA